MNERAHTTRTRVPSVAGRKAHRPEPAETRVASFVAGTAARDTAATDTAARDAVATGTATGTASDSAPAPASPGPAVTAGPTRRRGGRRDWTGVAVAALVPLAILSVVAATVLLVTGTSRHDRLVAAQRDAEAARGPAAASARAAATALLSYDYRHFDADVAKAEGYLTGKLRSDYDKLQRSSVGPTARQVHATVVATVRDVAVLTATRTTATVLVFVDQRSQNTRISAPRIDENRVTMQLVRSGGRWLVSRFDAV